jgi:hypothetical protein
MQLLRRNALHITGVRRVLPKVISLNLEENVALTETCNETEKVRESQRKRYVLGADERLVKRLDTHLKILKAVDRETTDRKDWVVNAIRNKLKKDKAKNSLSLNKPKYISLNLDAEIVEELDKRMELIRKYSGFSSQKKWILEAIEEQFEREELKVLELHNK